MPRLKAALVLLSLATAFGPVPFHAQAPDGAVPGSLNFVQGQVNIDGQPLNITHPDPHSSTLQSGQTLATANGSADVLLAPGTLLRLGQNSTVRMVIADATRTELRLERGRANVVASIVRKDHLLLIDLEHGQTQILSPGLYAFNTSANTLRVFNGEAYLFPGTDTAANVKPVTVREGHELIVGGDNAKPEKFDRDIADDALLPWAGPLETRGTMMNTFAADGGSAPYPGDNYGYGYGSAADAPGSYGFAGDYGLAYGFGYGLGAPLGYGYGLGSPFGYGLGFGEYPYFGAGYGFWGGYGGGYYGGTYSHYPPLKGPGSFGERGTTRQGAHLLSSGPARSAFPAGPAHAGGTAVHVGGSGGGMHMSGGGAHR